jgi:CheY-like chemotaxis protein
VPHTLLLADDSVTIQRVIELTFADEDVQVVAVGDGEQAIAVLDKTPPDIVLADVGMPGKTGYEVAQHIKETPRLAHIPVLLLTGAFEPVDQRKAAEAGCDGVLAKPFEPQLVIGRVKELLSKPKQSAPVLDIQPPPPTVAAEFGSYFDRLDAAFASLSTSAQVKAAAPVPGRREPAGFRPPSTAAKSPAREEPPPAHQAPRTREQPSSTQDVPPAFDRPLARDKSAVHVSPPAVEAVTQEVADLTSAPQTKPSTEPGRVLGFPPLADAFTALLMAEQSGASLDTAPAWPVQSQTSPEISQDLIEQVTAQVLSRLSDRVVRETVADVVTTIADRLVREEIERIKSAIK